MKKKFLSRPLALALAAAVTLSVTLLSACNSGEKTPSGSPGGGGGDSDALSWCTWGNSGYHQAFFDLLNETYPEIELDLSSYRGANRTEYSWVQMRAGDIQDIFITSQILDGELAKERLVDLSDYDFINQFSDKALDQVEIDGGIYLLPSTYSMFGIFYNKTLMEENGWELPNNFAELEALCGEIKEAGLIPGIVGTHLTGNTFSAIFNLAKTDWLTTPAGNKWEREFLSGNATAKGTWEKTMDYAQKYVDIGMFTADPDDMTNDALLAEYLGKRRAVFVTASATTSYTTFENGDELGMMPYIGEDGSKNVYMYSSTNYLGINKRLTEPGNEKKLENAVKLLSLLFSPEGQATLVSETTPCVMSVLTSEAVPESSMIYGAQRAMWDGRAFEMTYAHWDHILADVGQAFKDWLRGENQMDRAGCIARMDELQRTWLDNADQIYFCKSTADFTMEETARLVGKALGSSLGADAALIALNERHEGGLEIPYGVSGRLYAGGINASVMTTILPGSDGEYALITMTGAELKELAQKGFDRDGNGVTYPYVLVTRDGAELEDGTDYRVAFTKKSYTAEVSEAHSCEVIEGSLQPIMREYLARQESVSPDGNPWVSPSMQ